MDNVTPLLDKGKARISMPQDLEFKNFIKILIKTARVHNILFMTALRLLREDWE